MNGVEFVEITVCLPKSKLDEYRRLIIEELRSLDIDDYTIHKYAKQSDKDVFYDGFLRGLVDLRDYAKSVGIDGVTK